MIEIFLQYLSNKNKDYIIFDIGSRDCLQSIEFYNNYPNAKIYAFECNPNTINICKENIKNYKDRITLIETAICDYDGEITFYPINQEKTITTWNDGNPGASSLFKSNGKYDIEYYVQDEIITKCNRLDTVMKYHNIPKVDIIRMDLQGAELLALKGLGSFIKDVEYIYTEISYKEIYTGQVMFNELNDFIISNDFNIQNKLSMNGWQEDVIYKKNEKKRENIFFDIVITLGPNDIDIIKKQIEYTKKNIIGYRNIYIISYNKNFNVEGCITISEDIFPFSLETVSKYHGKLNRNGWYLQQLLKLYAGFIISDILDKYLVIDSDTFFIKETEFYQNEKCIYNYSYEYHEPYFIHMQKLHPELIKIDKFKSGICHHMIFETKYIKELFDMVENYHKDFFYNIFLKNVIEYEYQGSGASEYEIYFNYMLNHYFNEIIIRPLNWKNSNNLDELNSDYDYISYHYFIR